VNIFVLSNEPYFAAQYHCDKHVVKMILETAQLLATAHHELNPKNRIPIKPTHRNHPCAVWVRSCSGNYAWTLDLLYHLLREYTFRYEKVHRYNELYAKLMLPPSNIRNAEREPFVQCVPEKYKSRSAVAAYRAYYRGDKARFAKWKAPRTEPDWWNQ
jgi:hypothetical protein